MSALSDCLKLSEHFVNGLADCLRLWQHLVSAFADCLRLWPVSYTHLTLPTNREV